MKRCSGVLFPVSSLPSRFGIGDFGEKAKQFVDILVSMGFKLWQILPLNPIGYGHSPYQPFSSFAIDELYVSLDELAKDGLLKEAPFSIPFLVKAMRVSDKKEITHGKLYQSYF